MLKYKIMIHKTDMGRSCSQNGEGRIAFKILTGTPPGMRPLGRRRHR